MCVCLCGLGAGRPRRPGLSQRGDGPGRGEAMGRRRTGQTLIKHLTLKTEKTTSIHPLKTEKQHYIKKFHTN